MPTVALFGLRQKRLPAVICAIVWVCLYVTLGLIIRFFGGDMSFLINSLNHSNLSGIPVRALLSSRTARYGQEVGSTRLSWCMTL